MQKHTVVLPDGKTAKRDSVNRTYSHAVVARVVPYRVDYEQKPPVVVQTGEPAWAALSWSRSYALAANAARTYSGRPAYYLDVKVLPATVEVHTPKPRAPKGAL